MSRMLCTFCPPTILGHFYRIPETFPKLSADKMYGACETNDQTLKKIRTLPFPDWFTAENVTEKRAIFTNGKKTPKENPHKEFRRDPGRGVKEGA